MPRASIDAAITRPAKNGRVMAAAIAANVADGNSVTNTGRTVVLAENTGATPRIVTVHLNRTVQGQTVDPIDSEAIAAGATAVFGPYPIDDFGHTLNLNAPHAEVTFQVLAI